MSFYAGRVAFVGVLLMSAPLHALEPDELVLVVNRKVPASSELADHYRKVRNVPTENVLTLDLPTTEDISRADYNTKLRDPLRDFLKDRKDKIKAVAFIYGVPLRVGGSTPTAEERDQLKLVDAELTELRQRIDELKEQDKDTANEQRQLRALETRKRWLSHGESRASVDSELMLLWWDDYELRRWQMNPLYFRTPPELAAQKPHTLMTCRLDGPTPAIVRRMIDDAIATEKVGLSGKVYIDARGIKYDRRTDAGGTGYGGYDESMRETAQLFKDKAGLDVTLDDKQAVFEPNSCPECAIYCGWYSHAKFVDSCQLVKGSVAWHLASSEAVSLRRPDRTYWCKGLLENGACATLGPVAEPYTIGFPKPAEFFGFLATGKYTLIETYSKTVMLTSWMGTLIGDPMYNPFKKTPLIDEDDVEPSPRPN